MKKIEFFLDELQATTIKDGSRFEIITITMYSLA